MSDKNLFPEFEFLGDGAPFAEKIREVTPHNALFDDFTVADLAELGPFLKVYRAPPHAVKPKPLLSSETVAKPMPDQLAGDATTRPNAEMRLIGCCECL